MDEQKIRDKSQISLKTERPPSSISVTTGSPLTLNDGVELSTPNKLAIYCYIIDDNDGLDD